MKTFVYFIGARDGTIKIGTAADVRKRKAELQISHAFKLKLLAAVPGGRVQERAYHEQFAHLRLSGEWFRPGIELIAEIERLGGVSLRTWERKRRAFDEIFERTPPKAYRKVPNPLDRLLKQNTPGQASMTGSGGQAVDER